MERIIVLSDIHGSTRALRWVLENEPADAVFFLGDGLRDLQRAREEMAVPLQCPVYQVRGNCDAGWPDPAEGLAPFGGVLFFYTHGHAYGVKSGTDRLAAFAGERGADVALYGHTHRRALTRGQFGMATVFNPGSLYDDGSYGVIEIQDGGCKFGWKRLSL